MKNKKILLITCLLPVFFICGCATLRNPVPQELVSKATINNMEEIRSFMGITNPKLQMNLLESVKQEAPDDYPVESDGKKTYPMLIISGGGANGAYGAGLLKGWSKEGSRPMFKVVTGVSTGAIIAPFAFLGKDYDATLEKYYTTTRTKDVLKPKRLFSVLFGDSLASTQPLAKNLASVYDKDILSKIAAEHKRGRRLFVGTVNLDAQRFVVWDMGAIACREDLELFRKVILASASIPVIFPPVIFRVQANGKEYDEMHVDGGTITQAFSTYLLLKGMDNAAEAIGIDPSKMKSRIYIIRNGFVNPMYRQMKDKVVDIAERAMDTMINSQGVGDTYRMYVFAKERNNDYNLAAIPADYKPQGKEQFDPEEMKRLFDRGYQDAVGGYPWHKTPPQLETGEPRAGLN